MYDVLIIGAGPAGMTAAIYAARKKLKTLVLAKQLGGQMVWSSEIDNYSGFSMVSGADLTLKFREHLLSVKEDLEFREGVEVVTLEKNITSFQVTDKTGQVYYARSIIIASGRNPRHLGIPGEEKFFGKGVAVCATCDAPLYKGKDVAVIGGGNSAMDAMLALSKVARRVYNLNINQALAGDAVLRQKVEALPNVVLHTQTKVLEILGSTTVSGVRVQGLNQAAATLPVTGVFVEIGYEPSNSFDTLTEKNDHGEIKVDGNLKTSVDGIFAVGDINDAWGEQIIIAAGEGAKAENAPEDLEGVRAKMQELNAKMDAYDKTNPGKQDSPESKAMEAEYAPLRARFDELNKTTQASEAPVRPTPKEVIDALEKQSGDETISLNEAETTEFLARFNKMREAAATEEAAKAGVTSPEAVRSPAVAVEDQPVAAEVSASAIPEEITSGLEGAGFKAAAKFNTETFASLLSSDTGAVDKLLAAGWEGVTSEQAETVKNRILYHTLTKESKIPDTVKPYILEALQKRGYLTYKEENGKYTFTRGKF
jgi:alkyl hydroperoxide reductase subunit F